ncbi:MULTISPECIES: SDR family NAD(P)-dependent oxidoreductase [unclassified Mesorhizobium]|uniref:SDR family NAD(P)-dependent oxidoreductase n=1 Tax=unclassified Mesorhizobium TaxID=325217 RepID=UPI00112E85E4|nr:MULTISPECIES: SDR family NAD(P)-dependent oxidoreductase [unclassified Mesorhizobium]TPL00780.1 SDR family oxidoreductase [Mesorhizobium sp. B2-4-16]TPL76959.1 SDR family oxidoreductase [Mesorhizobium sp. B2-4-3]
MSSGAIIVTGGAGGIGRAIAARLSLDGYRVIIADRDGTAAEAVAKAIGCDFEVIDIGDEASVVAGVRAAAGRHGGLFGLVNNAGVHMQALVVETAVDDWDRIFRINSRGTFLMCREAARVMAAQKAGQIVNIATKLGFGNPFSSAYIASKNAIWGLTQCLAIEMASSGVRVNAVAPGHVGPGTGMEALFRQKADKLGKSWENFEADVVATIPLHRWCKPEDVAGAVAWLMGPDASFVTGELINITGGFQAYAATPASEAVREAGLRGPSK